MYYDEDFDESSIYAIKFGIDIFDSFKTIRFSATYQFR